MSILDMLSNGSLGSIINSMAGGSSGGSLTDSPMGNMVRDLFGQAKSVAGKIDQATPGGMGGLLGAGALGALLGNVMNGSAMRNVALAGIGAAAWNFYRKWSAARQAEEEGAQQSANYTGSSQEIPGFGDSGSPRVTRASYQEAELPSAPANLPAAGDSTSNLIMRAMSYAARADGKIDNDERQRMNIVLKSLFPGVDIDSLMAKINQEPIDPTKIAKDVVSKDQAEDVYRLSSIIIDPDQFMEISYMQALAQALGISAPRKADIEKEARAARENLAASLGAA